jgi:hypothetical protein
MGTSRLVYLAQGRLGALGMQLDLPGPGFVESRNLGVGHRTEAQPAVRLP